MNTKLDFKVYFLLLLYGVQNLATIRSEDEISQTEETNLGGKIFIFHTSF